ncbi:hypothetical protein Tcan_16528 [Toxocara canis]|uniref:Uncharacterized protein n=1 Tax=Toxocara canis TaxID=6265 RepID=A0A0B2VMB2_TOXCA|nr:hypothetical protein Tcan_16528 [Toxocara canis]
MLNRMENDSGESTDNALSRSWCLASGLLGYPTLMTTNPTLLPCTFHLAHWSDDNDQLLHSKLAVTEEQFLRGQQMKADLFDNVEHQQYSKLLRPALSAALQLQSVRRSA